MFLERQVKTSKKKKKQRRFTINIVEWTTAAHRSDTELTRLVMLLLEVVQVEMQLADSLPWKSSPAVCLFPSQVCLLCD